MPSENVDIARRWFTALGEGPEAIGLAAAQLADPEIVYLPVGKFPGGHPCHGIEEFVKWVADYRASYTQAQWTIESVTEVDDDRVMVAASLRAEGRGSGVELEGDVYHCFWFRDGRFHRIEDHMTLAGARGALGLDAQAIDVPGPSDSA